jgi:hypothetical protein
VIAIKIRPENTAIIQGVSKSTTMLIVNSSSGQTVLDYGAGKLRNIYHNFIFPAIMIMIVLSKS